MYKNTVIKNIQKFVIGLSWDYNEKYSNDLDIILLLLNSEGKLISPKHLIYYDNLISPDGAIQHTGDNLTGKGEGNDEVITGYLELLDPEIRKILVCINLCDITGLRTFKTVDSASVNIDVRDFKTPQMEISIQELYQDSTEIMFGYFEKDNDNHWNFYFLLDGLRQGINNLLKPFLKDSNINFLLKEGR